jgi:hypothetical protein
MVFRYRYVDVGAQFSPKTGRRGRGDGTRDPSLLYENEIAIGTPGGPWNGAPGGLAVIDRRARRNVAVPSISAAVLQHAGLIRERFRSARCVWLVTAKDATFDAFAAMFLCRWLIEDSKADYDWASLGLLPENSLDWFKLDVNRYPEPLRWAIVLASYASHVTHARRISTHRSREIHSVLYAALQRGRNYFDERSGAFELFDEARRMMTTSSNGQSAPMNPLYDSLFESSTNFAAELDLLDREGEAYLRDLACARTAIVFVPVFEGTFEDAFAGIANEPLLTESGEIGHRQLDAGGGKRQAVDGVYLRDPTCILFKEWARLDVDNSSLHEGFTLTMVAYSGSRGSKANTSEYVIAIDLENAKKAHLYPVWCRLQFEELLRFDAPENAAYLRRLREMEDIARVGGRSSCRDGYEARAHDRPELFHDPWYDGFEYRWTIIGTPFAGTLLPAGTERDLHDDRVAQIVEEELEYTLYAKPFLLKDVPTRLDVSTQFAQKEVPSPLSPVEPISLGCARFGSVVIRDHANLNSDALAGQIGQVLWRMLHPEQVQGPPRELGRSWSVRDANTLGVWSNVGVVVAFKESAYADLAELETIFGELAAVARQVHELIRTLGNPKADLAKNVQDGEQLMRDTTDIRYRLARPEGRVLERFANAARLFDTLDLVRDINRVQATQLQTERMTTSTETVAEVQLKVEWLELIFVGIYSTELAHIIAEYAIPRSAQLLVTLGGALGLTVIAALFLKPWKGRKGHAADETSAKPQGLRLIWAFVIVIVLGMFAGVMQLLGPLKEQPLPVTVEAPVTVETPAVETPTVKPKASPRASR